MCLALGAAAVSELNLSASFLVCTFNNSTQHPVASFKDMATQGEEDGLFSVDSLNGLLVGC